jgi:hypothetical protein
MSSTILPKNIDMSKLKYSEVKTLQSGAKSVYINYGTGKLRLQTPVMSMPYGLGEGYEDKQLAKTGTVVTKSANEKKYDLTLSFKGQDENPKIQLFHDKLKEIEQKIIDDAFNNRLEWFKDDFDGNKSFVAKLFNNMVKIDKDPKTGKPIGKYPPTFKVKIPFDNKNDKFTFDSYTMENDEVDFEQIMQKLKSGKCQLIIELSGIWFAGGKYGCTWKMISGKFQISQNMKATFIEDSDTEKAVIDDEEEDDEDISDPAVAVESSNQVDNSDEEEEESDVKPPPPAAKKGGRGAKK